MMPDANSGGMKLREALRALCDPEIRMSLRSKDEAVASARIHVYFYKRIDGPDDDVGTNAKARAALEKLERVALQDLKDRIERNEVHLTGVPTLPIPKTHPVTIPGVWATDLVCDLDTNTVQFHDRRYVRVRVHTGPARTALDDEHAPIDVDVLSLPHDTIAELLEEHARRVVELDNVKLLSPGKISVIPLLMRKLKHRAAEGLLLELVSAEAKWLAAWIKEAAPSHPAPSPSTIESAIRVRYAQLKPRSNGQV